MGTSGFLQYLIPFGFVIILFANIIVDFKNMKLFKYYILLSNMYLISQVVFFKYYYYTYDLYELFLITFFIKLIFDYIEIYIKIKNDSPNNFDVIKAKYTTFKMYNGFLLIFPLIMLIFKLDFLYGKNNTLLIYMVTQYIIAFSIIKYNNNKYYKKIKDVK